jgi:cytochrome b
VTPTRSDEPVTPRIRLKIWDGPTRIVHWLLVGLVGLAWWTGKSNRLDIHKWSGYTILGLIFFRALWGFAGSSSARFASFVRGPQALLAYARQHLFDRSHVAAGHNPMGGWSVVTMLFLLAMQTGTGLFAVDVDGIESGPLTYLISFDRGRQLAHLHRWTFNALLILIALHLCAVAFYGIYKRESLISAMVGGFKYFPAHARHQPVRFVSRWRVIMAVVVAAVFAACIAAGFQF